MPVALYMDVHVPQAIVVQLARRGVDVITAMQDRSNQLPDDRLLIRSTELGRVMVTFDVRFKAMAEDWQGSGRKFAGLIYAHPLRVSTGQLVRDRELIAHATDASDWQDAVELLPL